jgi:hypothetical protein
MAETLAPTGTDTPQTASDIVNADDTQFAEMFGFELPGRADDAPDETPDQGEDSGDRARDERGRFRRADEEPEGAPAAEGADTPEAEPEPIRKPMAPFKAFDKEGELDVPADLEIEFKADGEVRKLPLDKLIRHAQNGVYNERLVGEVKQARELVPQMQQGIQQLQQQLDAQLQLNARLLQDEEFFLTSREGFLREQTPEVQLEKYRAQMQAMQQQQYEQQELQVGSQFVTQGLEPRMMAILEQFPEVSWEEAFGRFSLAVAPLMRGGKVPTEAFNRVLDLVESDIGPWVAQRANERRTSTEQARRQLEETQRKARETVTQQKRTLARALAPKTGRAAPDKAQAKPVTTADEGIESILRSIMSEGI